MTRLQIGNSSTIVISDDEIALNIIKQKCTIKYDFFIRRKGSSRAKRDSRFLEYFSAKKPEFPTGWLGNITTELSRFKINFEIEDKRKPPIKIDLPILSLPDDPWDHQNAALISIQENERGIIQVPTRGGKTLIMALSIGYFQVPTLVLVPNRSLLHQEYDVFSEVFGEDKVGMLGDKKAQYDKQILVATIQTIFKRKDTPEIKKYIFNYRGCILLDECHHINHGGYKLRNTYFEITQRCKQAYYRIGFTATPGKTSSLERLFLQGVAGKLIYSIDIDTLKNRKILTPAKVLLVVINQPHTMTLQEHLEERNLNVPRGVDIEDYYRKMHIPIPNVPTFQQQVEKKITTNNAFRQLIKRIAEKYAEENKSVIVTVSRVEEGVEAFLDPAQSYCIEKCQGLHGKSPNRQEVLNSFRNGEFKILISTLVKEGIDLPRADVLVLASCDVMDPTPVLQRAGRVLTMFEGKEQATIIDFYVRDQGILERHSKARMKIYHNSGFEIDVVEPDYFNFT